MGLPAMLDTQCDSSLILYVPGSLGFVVQFQLSIPEVFLAALIFDAFSSPLSNYLPVDLLTFVLGYLVDAHRECYLQRFFSQR